jgi:hypothetical protein
MRALLISAVFLLLAACAGSEKGMDAGVGLDAMDTESKESKDNQKWFKSYYGKSRCVWGDGCLGDDEDDASGTGGGGGGMWSGGVGPSDSGSSSSSD